MLPGRGTIHDTLVCGGVWLEFMHSLIFPSIPGGDCPGRCEGCSALSFPEKGQFR